MKGSAIPKPPNTDTAGLIGILKHPLNSLLVCLPLGIVAHFAGWSETTVFSLNFVALVPLAKMLGDATEELAAGLQNDMLAGLLNATFGNAVEMTMMIQTLRAGLVNVVKATLLGSVLSNLLLVLGMSFFFGGIIGRVKPKGPALQAGCLVLDSEEQPPSDDKGFALAPVDETDAREPVTTTFVNEKVQNFSVISALVNTSMLLLSCLCLSLVTVFSSESASLRGAHHDHSVLGDLVIGVSRVCSIIMMISYVAYIFFQLVTHREAMSADGDDGDCEEATISVPMAVTLMLGITVIVAFCSDLLVSSLEGVVEKVHVSEHFIGIILLPIVGNACEHASAVRFAIMDKPGLAIGIAVGSSTQIAMFVVPFSVMVGWAMDKRMDLDFGQLNTTVLCVSIIVVLSIVVDGQANWLQGYLLISAYLIIAVLYFWLPNDMDVQT